MQSTYDKKLIIYRLCLYHKNNNGNLWHIITNNFDIKHRHHAFFDYALPWKITLKINMKRTKQKITNHLTSDTANIQINALSIRTKVHLTGTMETYMTPQYCTHFAYTSSFVTQSIETPNKFISNWNYSEIYWWYVFSLWCIFRGGRGSVYVQVMTRNLRVNQIWPVGVFACLAHMAMFLYRAWLFHFWVLSCVLRRSSVRDELK